MRQPLVLREAVNNKIFANDVDEVEIQTAVDNEIDDFFASVPPFVDVDISFWYLQSRRNPYAVDGNINGRYKCADEDFEAVGFLFVGEEDAAAVDDDLEKELDLESPCRKNCEIKCKAWGYNVQ